MLDGIKDILKTMGEALTAADAGEMLTAKQKAEVLNRLNNARSTVHDKVPPKAVSPEETTIPLRDSGSTRYCTVR